MYTLIDGVQFYDKDEVDDLFTQNGSTGLSGRLDQEAIDRAAADDALGTRIDQEAIDRAAADDALGTRIDQESNVRLLGDRTLANQLTALEQLWSTLVSANFIDTDSSAIVSDDSGKSVRQIAHDEFYRQLVTDADDVKHQLDTLKELADYLQNNPTILTDIYTKLGLTWSLDTPTDFGTFDFSSVLAATDIDSAIVELHNALTNKVGDLTQLTTAFKGTIVGAVNELDAEVGDLSALTTTAKDSIVSAVNELDTDIGNEVTARTDADTALGTRIDTEIGTLSALTTTAKDNVVAAINEVNDKVGTGGGGGGGGADTTQLEAKLNAEIAARTQGDTDLDNKITASVGTLSSLTTTAKTNLVAAVNEVKSDVSTKLSVYTTSMLSGHFVSSAGGYISLKDFWTRLFEKYGPSAEVYFTWAYSEAGFVSIDGTAGTDSVRLHGSTIIYYATTTPNNAWAVFNALVISGDDAHDAYIMTSRTRYTPGEPELNIITKLARAEAGGGGGGGGDSTYRYTFVVDSSAALTAWANNDRSGGKDYTSVLIRKGTWTSSKGVNLTAAGTKVVVGEAGSKLVFNGGEKGLYYATVPTGPEYHMCGVTVESTVTGNTVTGYGFDSCVNLTNCSGTVTGGAGTGYGFWSCVNLTNCSGTGTGTNGAGAGFWSCVNLTNCSGTGTGTNDAGAGFWSCARLTNCSGTGTGTNSGFGFRSCNAVIGCRAGGHCTTAAFDGCYASNTETSTYACADTANGGFNDTTNPAA